MEKLRTLCEQLYCRNRNNNRSNDIFLSCLFAELHNEELNDLYSSPNIVRVIKSTRMGWAEHVTRMGERRGVCMVLVGIPEGRRPLGRPRCRWEDNIKMDLQEVGYGGWIGSSWLRIVTCVCVNEPSDSIKCEEFIDSLKTG